MKITKVKNIRLREALSVWDYCVEQGYRQGPGRQLADVDIDFQSDRRQEVKEYLERRYNTESQQRVFSAGTYSSLRLKAVIKDVARVYRVPHNIVNYITAIFTNEVSDWTGLFLLASQNQKVRKFINDYPDAIEDIRFILGQPRSASIHASAIIITPETRDGKTVECFDYVPIKKMDNVLVSEFDGYSIDEIGLLKNDCLGVTELTKLQSVIAECNRVYDAGISFESIVHSELDDIKTYQILSSGHTQNVFQFSSRGMTKFLQEMHPTVIHDLIAANALYRPATLESGSAEKYLACRRGELAPVYLWGTYDALKDTYAQMVYQEQLAQIAREIGGFSLAEGVRLVKLISKKKVDVIHSMREKFMSGAAEKGCPHVDAESIWDMIEAGGSYLFNKSHATAYAITSYTGAWLKANYPSAFYTIALQWADDKEIVALMSEMESCSNARIVPPDINVSDTHFFTNYQTDEIFWSLTRIKMCGGKTVSHIISERVQGGVFTGIEDFIHRIFRNKIKKPQSRKPQISESSRIPVNARHVKNLILAGCFDQSEGIDDPTKRFAILKKASLEMGFEINETDFPLDKTDKHYFWSMLQISVSGIGQIDYRKIYDQSGFREVSKGRYAFMPLKEVAILDNEGRKIIACGTVVETDELSYMDKQTGEKVHFGKIILQQNNDTVELVCWNDTYSLYREQLAMAKDKIIIVSAAIRYSDYTAENCLNTFKNTLIYFM